MIAVDDQSEFSVPAVARRLRQALNTLTLDTAQLGPFFSARLRDESLGLIGLLEAASEGELHLSDAHSGSELVLDDAFRGSGELLFRGVHFATDSNFMSSRVVRPWAYRVDELLAQGRIHEIRRLVVLDSHASRAELMSFLASERQSPGHSYRVVSPLMLSAALERVGLLVPHDFGIYAGSYVFYSSTADPRDLSGVWLTKRDAVKAFISAFDDAWKAATDEP